MARARATPLTFTGPLDVLLSLGMLTGLVGGRKFGSCNGMVTGILGELGGVGITLNRGDGGGDTLKVLRIIGLLGGGAVRILGDRRVRLYPGLGRVTGITGCVAATDTPIPSITLLYRHRCFRLARHGLHKCELNFSYDVGCSFV